MFDSEPTCTPQYISLCDERRNELVRDGFEAEFGQSNALKAFASKMRSRYKVIQTCLGIDDHQPINGLCGVFAVRLQEGARLLFILWLFPYLSIAGDDLVGADEEGWIRHLGLAVGVLTTNCFKQLIRLGIGNHECHYFGIFVANCLFVNIRGKGGKVDKAHFLEHFLAPLRR